MKDRFRCTICQSTPYHHYRLITRATTVRRVWSLWSKFMQVIRDGTLRSSSLATRRPRRCNFEGNLT